MAQQQQTPKVVIAARGRLVETLKDIGGSRMTEPGAEAVADWLIVEGHLAESFYAAVSADLEQAEVGG